MLADQHQASLDQIAANQNTANQQMWDQVAQVLASQQAALRALGLQKMTLEDDLEALINAFEWTVVAAGWPPAHWSAILIPCLIGLALQAVDTLPLHDLLDFQKVKRAVLQTLNLNPEAYQR